jgi:ABC-type amino acid transport substrate-binding protein
MKKIVSLVGITLLMSCSSTKMSSLATPAYAPKAEINAIRANVEVDMKKKLVGESSASYFLFFRTSGDNKFAEGMSYSGGKGKFDRAKSSAAYKALENSNADIIVHPNYVVETERFLFFKKIHVKVTGYAGYFTKFYQKEYCDDCNDNNVELKVDVKSKKN